MQFLWHEQKNNANIAKHGISFEQAQTIFEGFTLSYPSPYEEEQRTITIGLYEEVAVIVVIHTDRHGQKRIISARPASRKERTEFRKALQQAVDRQGNGGTS